MSPCFWHDEGRGTWELSGVPVSVERDGVQVTKED